MRTLGPFLVLSIVGCDSAPPKASGPEAAVEAKPDRDATPAEAPPESDEPAADLPKADTLIVKICKAFDEEVAVASSDDMLLARTALRVTMSYGVAESELRGLERPAQLLDAIAREGNPPECVGFRERLPALAAAQ